MSSSEAAVGVLLFGNILRLAQYEIESENMLSVVEPPGQPQTPQKGSSQALRSEQAGVLPNLA